MREVLIAALTAVSAITAGFLLSGASVGLIIVGVLGAGVAGALIGDRLASSSAVTTSLVSGTNFERASGERSEPGVPTDIKDPSLDRTGNARYPGDLLEKGGDYPSFDALP